MGPTRALLCGFPLFGAKKTRGTKKEGVQQSLSPHIWHDTVALAQSGLGPSSCDEGTTGNAQNETVWYTQERARHSMSREFLQEVCERNKAVYAILWQLGEGNRLRVVDSFNPEYRVEAARQRQISKDDETQIKLYTTESILYSFSPGQGCVGQVHLQQQARFFNEVARDAPQNFYRMRLAAKYAIKSVAFHPCGPTEVLEFGTAASDVDGGRFFRARKTSSVGSSVEAECLAATDLWMRQSHSQESLPPNGRDEGC